MHHNLNKSCTCRQLYGFNVVYSTDECTCNVNSTIILVMLFTYRSTTYVASFGY